MFGLLILTIDKPQYSLPVALINLKLLHGLGIEQLNLVIEPHVKVAVLGLLGATECDDAVTHVLDRDLVLFPLVHVYLVRISHSVLVHSLEALLLLDDVRVKVHCCAQCVHSECLLERWVEL